MGEGEGSWAREGSSGEELGGEEPAHCDWARKGTAVGKVLMAWACVQGYLGRKRGLGQDWSPILPEGPGALSICRGSGSLPGAPRTEILASLVDVIHTGLLRVVYVAGTVLHSSVWRRRDCTIQGS